MELALSSVRGVAHNGITLPQIVNFIVRSPADAMREKVKLSGALTILLFTPAVDARGAPLLWVDKDGS